MRTRIALRLIAVAVFALVTALGCGKPESKPSAAQTTPAVAQHAAPAQTERPSSKPLPSVGKPLNSKVRRSAIASLSRGDDARMSVLTNVVIKP